MAIKKKYIDMPVDWKKMYERLNKENELLIKANSTFSCMQVEYKIGFEIEEAEGRFHFCEATYYDVTEAIRELHELRYNNHSDAYKIFCRYVTQYQEYVIQK